MTKFVLLVAWLLFSVTVTSEDIDIVDLYSKEDVVVHMDHTNFEKLLFGKTYIWVIEFYNSWCGHCQLYAPSWRSFAQRTSKWGRVARVGAINCVRSENLPLCRNYEINAYPWVTFFRPQTTKGDIGEHRSHGDPTAMMDLVVNFAHEVQQKSHPPLWPNLDTFLGPLSVLLASPEPVQALVLESDQNSTVGRTLVLDFANQQRARVVRALTLPEGLQLEESARPLLVTWRRGHRETVTVPPGLQPRNVFGNTLKQLLGIATDEEGAETATTKDMVGTPARPAEADSVYMVDLENAVTYAISHEVAGKKSITGEPLTALREFLALLVRHLPVRESVLDAVQQLLDIVNSRRRVSGEEIQQQLDSGRIQLPPHRPWQGCRGSQARYRGYPCGLWTLFHTLTVHASEEDQEHTRPSVLPVVHGYVRHFFSCSHCSQHFQQMAIDEGLFNVTDSNEAAIWLWRAHNLVNKRLAGDVTEDPQHPKVQFPSRQLCAACLDGDEYIPVIVLAFLRNFYSQSVIRLDGLTTASDAGTVDQRAVDGAASTISDTVWQRPINFGPITSADISLCVMLWLFSFVTLLLAFFLFRMKRRYKRKHSHPYFP